MNDKQFEVLQSCLSPVVSDSDEQVKLFSWFSFYSYVNTVLLFSMGILESFFS